MTALTRPEFAPHINTAFHLSDSDHEVQLELVEVSDLVETPGQERFSVMFRGPLQPFVPQGCYQFKHDVLGEFPLFIVPLRQDPNGFYYEAGFNRLKKIRTDV